MSEGKQPNIRFKEFEDAWEQRKLGEMGDTFSGLSGKSKQDFGHGDARFVTYMNVYTNVIAKRDGIDDVEIDNKQTQVKYGDVFFTTSSETPDEVAMTSVWLFHDLNVYLNSFCFGYRPNVQIDPYFLGYLLRSSNLRMRFNVLAQGISRYNISKKQVMKLKVSSPKLSEQKLIGKLFISLGDLITANQNKLEQLKRLKKLLMQKIFDQEWRFKGFNDPWEQRKLGEIAPLKRGFDLPKSQIQDGPYPVVFSNGIGAYNSSFRVIAPGVVTGRSGSIGNVIYVEKNFWPHNTSLWVTNFNKNIPKFIYYLYQHINLNRFASGSGVPTLNRNDVHNHSVLIPNVGEQQKIANLLTILDLHIAANQRRIDQLKSLKKYLMQNMFV